jgi:hypothetical protein
MHLLLTSYASNAYNISTLANLVFKVFVDFFTDVHFRAVLSGVVCFWGGVFVTGVVFLMLASIRKEKVGGGGSDQGCQINAAFLALCGLTFSRNHEDSVSLSVCKVHISATRWRFYT